MTAVAFPKPLRKPKTRKSMKRRRPMARHAPKRELRPESEDGRAYRAFVKTRQCEARFLTLEPCHGPRDPHHCGRRPGMGMKCPDHQTIALCRFHHRMIERQPWKFGLQDKAVRFIWLDSVILVTQAAARVAGLGDVLDRLVAAAARRSGRLLTGGSR